MALATQHVSGFSPNGKLFALINDQGILRIWDTETNDLKQEYTPNLHLSGPCSAIVWVTVSASSQKKKKSRGSLDQSIEGSQTDCQYLVLGGSNGEISLYSYNSGTVEHILKGEKHAGKITGVAYDGENLLYTCGEDCQVIVWNLSLGKRVSSWSIGSEKPYSITYLPESKNIVVGCRQIKVFSVKTKLQIQTLTGHTSEVTTLQPFSYDDVEYILSASKMERVICLWTIASCAIGVSAIKHKKTANATCTFLMEDIANIISCSIQKEDEILHVASCTRSGVIHFYKTSLNSLKTEKPIKPKVTIELASDSSTIIEPIPAVAVSLKFSSKSEEILFGYGDKHFIVFEKVVPNFSEKLNVLVRSHPKTKLKNIKNDKKQQQSEKALKTLIPTVNSSDVSYKSSTAVPSRKLGKAFETPMETRLQNLNINNGEIPQAQSKVQLLVQALHSKDATLLNTVLSTNDLKVVKLTLQKLPVQYVESLVNELTFLMQKKRIHVHTSLNWLKILTQTHSSQLMALGHDDLLNKFGPCIAVIEHRSNCLPELSKLNGRLQLLVSQIKRNNDEDNLKNDNVLVYQDNDDSSNSENGEAEKSISDDEWEEDDNEDSEMES